MARYLTPAKIGILSLIELYTDEHVPNAAIIPVLSFITSHVLDYDPESFNSSNAASWDKAKKAVSIVVSIQDFESLLNPYPVLPTVSHRRRRNPSFGRMSFDHVLEVGEHDDWDPEGVEALASVAYGGLLTSAEPSSLSVSTDDVELLLEFQIEQMQKHGNRVPAEVQHKFRDLLKDSVVVPSTAHYLSVLGAGKESLAYLRVKAKETNMGTLWSSVLISEAKLGLMNGESVATSLELLVRSSHLIVEKNMKNMFGAQLSMKMALLDRIGLAHLSNMESEMFLRCHARQSVFDDELKVTCRLAVQLAERGKYDDALKKLEALDENALRSWKPSQYWFKYRGIIKLTRDLRHNNLDGAEQILSQLLQSKMDDMEPDIAFMIDYLHIDCLKRRGDLSSAFEKVEDMLEELQEENRDLSLRLQLMLVKAHLYDKAGRPQRGFTLAMRAASMAWRARLVPNLWHAIGAIANILTSLGEFQAAIDLLTAILPRSLECDSARLSGTLYSHLADATMGLAGSAPSGSARRTECMTRALRAVEKAFDCYSSVEEIVKQCEMMAKKATIMRVAGDKALAADCAATYVALRKHAAVLAM
ncbi:hypothetical protein BN1708_008298 [Verticillium longisporum]|uniref:Anaphase-promoting complex subunit 5 n=1 Tax=Verticillium longisporum TaxID=100787 RepID=A0A0G4N254_VERLO|nr:hypothetical protein BN1708_008298 [Verticillium longisporum]